MAITTGSDGVLDDVFSYQVYNKIKNHWRAAAAPANVQVGMIWSDSDDNKLYHYTGSSVEIIQQGHTGKFYINETANTKMTTGITINQGTASDEIFAAKSSDDVAHGCTTITETDTYAFIRKYGDAEGGLRLVGLRDSGVTSIRLQGYSPTIDSTLSTAGRSIIEAVAELISGTGTMNMTASSNLFGVRCQRSGSEESLWLINQVGNTWQLGDAFMSNVALIDTGSDHYLLLGANENLSANKILYFVTGDSNRTITLSGNPTLNDWFDQSVKVAASPQFASLFINETANTGMAIGITINQGTNDNEILAFKSGDVAHGVTTVTETDSYGIFKKYSGDYGGLQIHGLSDATTSVGINMVAHAAVADTAKSTGALGTFYLESRKISGTGYTNWDADANIFVLRCSKNGGMESVALVDEDGDIHSASGAGPTIFPDKYDDIALVDDLKSYLSTPKNMRKSFKDFIKYNRRRLVEIGVISDGDFISWKGMNALLLGAISQLGQKNRELENRLNLLGA